MVQTFDRHVQGFVVSPAFDGYLFVGESEIIIGRDVIDYTLKPSTDMSCATWASFKILTNNAR